MDKETRNLVVAAVGLVVVLFTGRALLGSFLGNDGGVTQVNRAASSLRSGDARYRVDRAALAEATRLGTQLSERLDELLPELAYARPEGFDVPAGASADLRYIEVLRREQEQLVEQSRYVGMSVPTDLGMPVPNPTGLEDVLDAMRALHVVHLVVEAAREHDVRAIDGIRLPPARRTARRTTSFLKRHPVEFDLEGSPAAVRATLQRLGDVRPVLALDDVHIEALDEDGELVRCRFSAATLDVDLETDGRNG